MAKTSKAATQEWAEDVKHFIQHETHIGISGLAKLCGYSPSVIGSALSGKYEGDLARVQTRVDGAIDLHRARAARRQKRKYVATDQSRIIEAAITYALRYKQSAAVLAESGCGKTITAMHMQNREFGIVYVACDSHDFRQGAFLERIAAALGISARSNSTWRLQRNVAERLRAREWVLVVDDSHYLLNPSRPGRSMALDTLKDLQSLAETPCVILGVPELWETVERQLNGGWYAQLRGRLGMVQRMHCREIQSDDVDRVVSAMGARCASNALSVLAELAHQIGGYRNVEKAIRWATRDGAEEVTLDALKPYLSFSGLNGALMLSAKKRELPPETNGRQDHSTPVPPGDPPALPDASDASASVAVA